MMTNFPWLTLLWLMPLVGAALIIVLPASLRQFAKYAGLVVALAVLVLALLLAVRLQAGRCDSSSSSRTIRGSRRSAPATSWASTASRWRWWC